MTPYSNHWDEEIVCKPNVKEKEGFTKLLLILIAYELIIINIGI